MDLKNKVALVTGASSGIGRAIAIALAKEGVSVIVNYKSNSEFAENVVHECNKYSQGNMALQGDLSRETDTKNMISKIKKRYSEINILVNSAGIFDESDSPTNLKAFQRLFENNFLSCITVTKYVVPMMKSGKIINISSIHGRVGHGRPEAIAYSACKAALDSYTKNLAKELAPRVLVNAIAPGRVNTPMWGSPDAKEQVKLGEVHLIKRMIDSDEVADAALFLIKNDAMCGEILTIDGGMSLVTLG